MSTKKRKEPPAGAAPSSPKHVKVKEEPHDDVEMKSASIVSPRSAKKEASAGYTSLTSFGISDKGKKHYQQDRRVIFPDLRRIAPKLIPSLRWSYVAVFDGHGGHTTSQHLSEFFHLNLVEKLGKTTFPNAKPESDLFKQTIRDVLIDTYRSTDKDFLEKTPGNDDGSTAITALIVGQSIWIANVGDSKGVLARRRKLPPKTLRAIRLSIDHTPVLLTERTRVEKRGGFVDEDGRVCGMLGVSRAFGDAKLKSRGVSVVPDISRFSICDDDSFMLFGCDGLWEVFTPEDAVNFCDNMLQQCRQERTKYGAVRHNTAQDQTLADAKFVATKIVEEATVVRNAKDNVTAIITIFGHSPAALDLLKEKEKK